MKLKICLLTIRSIKEFKEDSVRYIRGFMSEKFPEYDLFHNHTPGGKTKIRYQYPLIQFKLIENKLVLVGINEGADVLENISNKIDTLILNREEYKIIEKNLKTLYDEEFGLTQKYYFYELITPWLALNEDNFEEYILLEDNDQKVEKLRSILKGNLQSMSKRFDYSVDIDKIKCDIDLKSSKTNVKINSKDQKKKFISFTGGIIINFCVPDYLGIGKSTSKGYGTIRKIDQNQSSTVMI